MNVWESNWCSSRIWKNCFFWWMFSSIFIAYSTLGLLRWDFFQSCQINWKWLAIYLEGKYPWLGLNLKWSRDTENKYQDVLITAISWKKVLTLTKLIYLSICSFDCRKSLCIFLESVKQIVMHNIHISAKY